MKEEHILGRINQIIQGIDTRNFTHPPKFAIPMVIAIATPLLTSPPALPPAHASTTAILGNTPQAAITAPAYATPA
jgi:hypothetical protein